MHVCSLVWIVEQIWFASLVFKNENRKSNQTKPNQIKLDRILSVQFNIWTETKQIDFYFSSKFGFVWIFNLIGFVWSTYTSV
jgi:hypothetical protein